MLLRMEAAGVSPNTVTYNALLDAYAKARDLKACENMLLRMEAAGVRPDTVTYTALLDAYAKARDLKACENMLLRMEAAGVSPDTVTFSTLLKGYVRVRDEEAKLFGVRRALGSMERLGLALNSHTYGTVLQLFVGQPEESRRYFRAMLAQGVQPLPIHWNWLRRALEGADGSGAAFGRFCAEVGLEPPQVCLGCACAPRVGTG
jgi:pentatricopeptide repeat protein